MTTTVLALVTDAFGGHGGIAQYNRDFLVALDSAGLRVVTLPRHAPSAELPPNGIEQRPAKFGRLSYSWSVFVELLRLKPDIIFCGHVYMASLGWIAAIFSGASLVVQTHGVDAWIPPSRLNRLACEHSKIMLSVSRYTRSRILGWATIAPERVVVLPNTVSDCYTPGDGTPLRRAWGLEGRKVLLTVGRMASTERYKGYDRVIKALPALIAARHDVVFIISGEGDDQTRLEQLAHKAGVTDRVRFVGALPREKLIEAYRMADLFVMPSTGEGFGIVFLEAMACGTPALGIDVAGVRDALADGELGILTTSENLAFAIGESLTSPKADPDALYRAVQLRFGFATFRARVHSVFSELLKTA